MIGRICLALLLGLALLREAEAATCAGAETLTPLMEKWAAAYKAVQVRPFKLSADGFAALLAGKMDCAAFVREPFPAERAAFAAKFGIAPILVPIAGGSYATKGGTHALAIYVHEGNPLHQITLTQLRGVFGRPGTRSWGALGLPGDWVDRPIHLYGMLGRRTTGNPPGIVNYLTERVLLGGTWRDDIRVQPDLQSIVDRVAADPDGIGYSGFAYLRPGAKTLSVAEEPGKPFYPGTPATVARRDYPLSRQIYLLLPNLKDPVVVGFVRHILSREGQKEISQDSEGFMPLTAEQLRIARQMLE